MHYYFYFIDEEVGLCYLRVPTWCPFRLQFYCNGHSWLETKLITNGIGYAMADNAFIRIDDFAHAQSLSDQLKPDDLHRILDRYARMCCPVQEVFQQQYHWSLMQTEYSTDLVFRSEETLNPLYEDISRQAVIAVKAEQVSSFLGKKITPQLAQELGSRLSTRIEGTCIKHYMGSASVKIYNKFKRVLRIETTANDVSFFKHHRKVEHRDGSVTRELASLKKSIYSLIPFDGLRTGICAKFFSAATAAISNSYPRSMIAPMGIALYKNSLKQKRIMVSTSAASISLMRQNKICCVLFSGQNSISAGCVEPI